ncbi:transporter substrate-binding domain-containing protein [Motilimonas cestriensis]|uniref:Transporter substrate-binding domain-containing protein n=1 Tax=Motilimonas cestriensis TaxID=2742685 RepID=A0ABS8W3Z0_9GAMM|nr:transporter substrate-binding domain-containing protein [Motilimonas cestriensis]MCE2593669.1 transporter substrate-binding domain-containing protein [Motilimonas cestriensis]
MAKYYSLLLTIFFATTSFAQKIDLVTLQYPPYQYESAGEVKGIAVDIVKEAFGRLGIKAEIRVLPWSRAIRYIEQGQADAIFTAFKTPEREKFADYSNEILLWQTISLFVRSDSTLEFNGDLKTLRGMTVGVVKGVNYGKSWDAAMNEGVFNSVELSNEGEQNMRKLLVGRVPIIVSNRFGAYANVNKTAQLNDIRELKPALEHIASYIAFSKKRNLALTRDQFDQTLKQMKQDGSYQRIISTYYNEFR